MKLAEMCPLLLVALPAAATPLDRPSLSAAQESLLAMVVTHA
jgi:hypothetical protein